MIALDTPNKEYLNDEGVRLMLALQRGDNSAMRHLIEKYRPIVLAVVRSSSGIPETEEDVVQEVFLRVFQARERYVPAAKFHTWLTWIAKNLVINLRRNFKNRATYATSFPDSWPTEGDRLGGGGARVKAAPENCLDAEFSGQLREAVSNLSARQRQAVKLVYFSGLSCRQAAIEMETTPAAVKAMLARARTHLRKLLS